MEEILVSRKIEYQPGPILLKELGIRGDMGSGSQVLAGPRIEGLDASGTKAYHWE